MDMSFVLAKSGKDESLIDTDAGKISRWSDMEKIFRMLTLSDTRPYKNSIKTCCLRSQNVFFYNQCGMELTASWASFSREGWNEQARQLG